MATHFHPRSGINHLIEFSQKINDVHLTDKQNENLKKGVRGLVTFLALQVIYEISKIYNLSLAFGKGLIGLYCNSSNKRQFCSISKEQYLKEAKQHVKCFIYDLLVSYSTLVYAVAHALFPGLTGALNDFACRDVIHLPNDQIAKYSSSKEGLTTQILSYLPFLPN